MGGLPLQTRNSYHCVYGSSAEEEAGKPALEEAHAQAIV